MQCVGLLLVVVGTAEVLTFAKCRINVFRSKSVGRVVPCLKPVDEFWGNNFDYFKSSRLAEIEEIK